MTGAQPDLPEHFWTMPAAARTTLPTKSLRAILLRHDGQIMACGRMWTIHSKRIGPGVYEVWLDIAALRRSPREGTK